MNATQPPPADFRNAPPPSGPPATPPPAPPRPSAPKRPWRERMPEVVATIGTSLVVIAIVGFVTSSWDQLLTVHKAMTLAAVAIGLTVAGVYVEGARRRSMSRVVALVYLSASVSVAAAATLFGYAADPSLGRVGIAVGGLAAAVHAAWVLSREMSSATRVGAVGAALVYAAGPAGTTVTDRFSTMDPWVLTSPLLGLFDPAERTDMFVAPGVGWAAAGMGLLALSTRLTGAARHAATCLASGTLFGAAVMLNVATDPLGAFAALCIVVGYLLYGMVTERPGITTVGAIGVLVAGIRVVWGLFSGQVAVTAAALAVGVAMLAWAVRAARSRPDSDEDSSEEVEEEPVA